MKKIILSIFMSVISSGVMANDVSSNQIDLNKPVRWYAKALSNAIFTMHYKYNHSADGAQQASAIAREFLQTLDIKNGVVSLSVAEFIEKCMSVYHKPDADKKCSDAVIDAVRFHNELTKSFTNLNTLDMSTKIEWNFRVWYNALTAILVSDSAVPLANIFSDYMKSVNNMASLNDWLAECNRALQHISSNNTPYHKDVVVKLESHGFTCQKYIESLSQTQNEFKELYGAETEIKL